MEGHGRRILAILNVLDIIVLSVWKNVSLLWGAAYLPYQPHDSGENWDAAMRTLTWLGAPQLLHLESHLCLYWGHTSHRLLLPTTMIRITRQISFWEIREFLFSQLWLKNYWIALRNLLKNVQYLVNCSLFLSGSDSTRVWWLPSHVQLPLFHTGIFPNKILVYLIPFWHLLLRGQRLIQLPIPNLRQHPTVIGPKSKHMTHSGPIRTLAELTNVAQIF